MSSRPPSASFGESFLRRRLKRYLKRLDMNSKMAAGLKPERERELLSAWRGGNL